MGKKMFRCSEVGYTECDWHIEGNSEEEMIPLIERHAREVHHLELKREAIDHIRSAIHEQK
jgi:predicted small metal-binding protein